MTDTDPWTETLGFTDLGTEDREDTISEVKELVENIGSDHPEVFEEKPITPQEYERELVDAIHSLDGTYKQGRGVDSEDVVRRTLLDPAENANQATYVDQHGDERIDFKGRLSGTGETFAMDVKGGEGQSIGHLLVPSNTEILVFWMERNSMNTKGPASRLNEVINRVVRWGINHDEHPSYIINHDNPAGATTSDGSVIPDTIVFPEQFPSPSRPDPQLPSLEELHFPEVVYDVLVSNNNLCDQEVKKHIWWHELRYIDEDGGKVGKDIYNAYDEDITLQTQSIDFDRISEV